MRKPALSLRQQALSPCKPALRKPFPPHVAVVVVVVGVVGVVVGAVVGADGVVVAGAVEVVVAGAEVVVAVVQRIKPPRGATIASLLEHVLFRHEQDMFYCGLFRFFFVLFAISLILGLCDFANNATEQRHNNQIECNRPTNHPEWTHNGTQTRLCWSPGSHVL